MFKEWVLNGLKTVNGKEGFYCTLFVRKLLCYSYYLSLLVNCIEGIYVLTYKWCI